MATQDSLINHLRMSLVQLICLVSALNPSQLRKIHQVEKCFKVRAGGKLDQIVGTKNQEEYCDLISKASRDDFTTIMNISQLSSFDNENMCNNGQSESSMAAFASLFRLLLLQETLHNSFVSEDIISLKKILPFCKADQQLKLVRQLQVIMQCCHPDHLCDVYQKFQKDGCFNASFEEQLETLQDHMIIAQCLREFFYLPFSQIARFFHVLPRLQEIQLVQLIKLLQLDILTILEVIQLLTPQSSPNSVVDTDINMNDNEESSNSNDSTVEIKLIDNAPAQAVYKRNLRPFPSVMLSQSSNSHKDSTYRVVPTIYRCDTQEEIQNSLVGDHSQIGTVGSLLKFKKLKIQYTSRQVGDSLFAIRFSVYPESKRSKTIQAEPICFVHTTPIQVVSHSSLIGKSKTSVKISEIIPSTGSTEGRTRVAILGSNFPDESCLRIWFGGEQVSGELVGANTIICYTPPHQEGEVQVHVGNESSTHSSDNAGARFCYERTESSAPYQLNVSGFPCDTSLGIDSFNESVMLEDLTCSHYSFLDEMT